MSRRAIKLAALALLVAWLSVLIYAAVASHAATSRPTVVSLKLHGVVDPFMASYVKRGIDAANHDGDAAVLLTIDTPGGLDTSMRDIVKAILASRVPVICWTGPSGARAASAGTFIMLACPINAMAPGTEIGAAHPVGVSGVIENEKVTNDAAAFIQSLAKRWGRNSQWAVSAVRQATSASAQDALRLHVVDFVAASPAQLFTYGCASHGISEPSPPRALTALCTGAEIQPFHMSITESLFHSIADPNVAFLLINIGFLALIVWVFHPGFHVSLGVGIVCMVIGLAILETLPVRLVGLILLAVSGVLFVLDVKAKAHGVLTAGGIATLILGGLLLFNPSVPNAQVSRPLIAVVAVLGAVFTTVMVRALLGARGHSVKTGIEALEGSSGVALTDLGPTGRVRARAETWTAESVRGPIAAGTSVRIVSVRGGVKLLVEPMEESPVATVPAAPGEGETT
jgi:membrane-bound serine protease (ClpP class)